MRKLDRQVRRNASGRGSFVECLRRAVRAGKCVTAHVADGGHAELARRQCAGHFARRAPSSKRVARNRFEVAPKPPGRVRLRRIRRPPDVEPLKVRPARILITGSLNDGEAPLVEDALQPGQPRMQTEGATARVASNLEHLTGGHGDGGPAAVIELILIRHDGIQRIVPAPEIHDDKAARPRSLRAGDVTQERRRREADGERRNATADEVSTCNGHGPSPRSSVLSLQSSVRSLQSSVPVFHQPPTTNHQPPTTD